MALTKRRRPSAVCASAAIPLTSGMYIVTVFLICTAVFMASTIGCGRPQDWMTVINAARIRARAVFFALPMIAAREFGSLYVCLACLARSFAFANADMTRCSMPTASRLVSAIANSTSALTKPASAFIAATGLPGCRSLSTSRLGRPTTISRSLAMALMAVLSPLKNWSTIFCNRCRLTASSTSTDSPSASRALRTPSRKESIFWMSPLMNGKQALRSTV